MKNTRGYIRWKYVIPTLIFTAAMLVFFIFFFDPLAGHILGTVGSKINGAKVDVSGFKTKFFQGRVTIARVQVTNKNIPMQNLVEAGPLAFQVDLSNLFSKRVIINEATLKGVAFNTARKKSGALPRLAKQEEKSGPPSAASKLMDKYKDRFKLQLEGLKGEAKEKITFDPKQLELSKQSDAIKQKIDTLPDEWKKKVATLDVDGRLKKIDGELQTVKNTPTSGVEAIKAIPEALKQLKTTKEELNQLKSDLQNTKKDASSQITDVKTLTTNLREAKKKDIDGLLSRFNLDFADPQRLVEGLIGSTVLDQFKTIFKYVELARQHMPSKKEKESLPPKPRAKGMDILFPTPAAPPRFWLIKGGLEGTYQDVQAVGTMSDLTSDPSRVGKPFILNMTGQKGTQKFLMLARFDHTTDLSKDSVAIQTSGFQIKDMAASGALGESLSAGMGSADVTFSLIGEGNIGGEMKLSLSQLKFDDAALLKQVGVTSTTNLSREDEIKMTFMKNVARSIEAVPSVQISAQIFGTWSDPSLKITSNLNETISKAIKSSLGNVVQDQRKQLEAQLDQILKDRTGEINTKLAGLQGQVNDLTSHLDKNVQDKINQATGINLPLGGGSSPLKDLKIPSLDKFFKK